MKTPWKYSNLELPIKLPPPINPMNVKGLPIIGYLEQQVADILNQSLLSLAKSRPKYPFLDPVRSAAKFLYMDLKGRSYLMMQREIQNVKNG